MSKWLIKRDSKGIRIRKKIQSRSTMGTIAINQTENNALLLTFMVEMSKTFTGVGQLDLTLFTIDVQGVATKERGVSWRSAHLRRSSSRAVISRLGSYRKLAGEVTSA